MSAKVNWKPNAVTLTGGSLRGVEVDMNRMPDAAMTLAVVALFAEGTTAIHNIYNWRVKETERLEAVCTELRKLGAAVDVITISARCNSFLKASKSKADPLSVRARLAARSYVLLATYTVLTP